MGVLGFPEPAARPPVGGETPESLARRIDAAVAAVEPGKRGRLILSVTDRRAGIDLMWRIAGPATIVARISKPRGLAPEAEALLSVSFLASPQVREAAEEATATLPRVGIKDCYRALRLRHDGVKRNGRLRAAIKALGMARLGWRPYLDGGEWFDRG